MKRTNVFIGFAALAMLSTSALAITATSPWSNQQQVHSNWCWDASVRNLIYTESNSSINAAQCNVGNFVFGVNYACNYEETFDWNDSANTGNWLKSPGTNDVYAVLNKYGYGKLGYSQSALSFSALRNSIDNNHGVLTDWRWSGGGGHIVLANGYDVQANGSQWVELFNPWPGEGQYWLTYNAYVGSSDADHTTVESLRVTN